jgi:heme/copper-type cytochrome/quinol oxidase subunit 2
VVVVMAVAVIVVVVIVVVVMVMVGKKIKHRKNPPFRPSSEHPR